ncbi:unnamed protein product [Durusdinium trenchii]|uniref:PPPDE domain-containing protein n=1 Tax=Durusdinium trenchii TaxID=1381693 RepID=A0ABP0JJ86_9DINO
MWHVLWPFLVLRVLRARCHSHGSGQWMVGQKPVLRVSDANLGWRMHMESQPEAIRFFLQAVNKYVGDPLYQANSWLNEQGGKACVYSGCAISLGRGSCDRAQLFDTLAKALAILARAQELLEPDFREVCRRLGDFHRSRHLGLGEPLTVATTALGAAIESLQRMHEKLLSLDGGPCLTAMGQVLYTNVEISRIGLEKTSQIDHQVTIEAAQAEELPHGVLHRLELGLHHNDIVSELLRRLLPEVQQTGRQELYMVEVGTASAAFTVHLLQAVPQAQVITIDPWMEENNRSSRGRAGSRGLGGPTPRSSLARHALEPWNDRVAVLQMTGEKAAKLLADSTFDLVFVDSGDHREADVLAFLPKVRPGGILCGHDFYKTAAYTRTVLASVPQGKFLEVGPDWMWWFKVWLYQYDISNGLAAWAAPVAMFQSVEGIWHTGIVVFGKEYWYGGQCFESKPETTPFGVPKKRSYLGAWIPREDEVIRHIAMARACSPQKVLICGISGLCAAATLLLVLGSALTRYRYSEPCELGTAGDSQALFDYMSFYSCSELLPGAVKVCFLLLWLALLISMLASTADDYFVPQLEALSERLGLEEDVAGVTLLALGNGMPDVMTACSSVNKANDLALTMGEFLGAANFIIVFVFACVLLASPGATSVDAWPFLRDSSMYLLVVFFMVFVTWDGQISLVESLAFFALYGVYLLVVLLPSRLSPRTSSTEDIELEEPNSPSDSFQPLASESEAEDVGGLQVSEPMALAGLQAKGNLSLVLTTMELPFTLARHVCIPSAAWNGPRRVLAALCPTCGSLFMILSFGGWEAFAVPNGAGGVGVPGWAVCGLVGMLLGVAVLRFSTPARMPRWHLALLLWAMCSAVSWFNFLANECVAVLEAFGLNLGISSSVLGITVLAWGNSVGDLVADTALVRQRRSKMAVAGIYGSPLLSDLLGLGIALTSHTWQHGDLRSQLSKQNRIAAVSLLLAVVMTMAVFAGFRFHGPRRLAWVLLGHYAIFMVLSVACELGFIPDVP